MNFLAAFSAFFPIIGSIPGFALEMKVSEAPGGLALEWNPQIGKQYQIQRTFDFTRWFNVGVFGSESSQAFFSGPESFQTQYFRVGEDVHPLESEVIRFYTFDADANDPRIASLPAQGCNLLTEFGFQSGSGKSGNAASFDAKDTQKWVAQSAIDFSSAGDSFFFSLWINKDSGPTIQSIFGKSGEYLCYERNGDLSFILTRTSPGTVTVKTTGSPIQPGRWHHVLIWYDQNVNALNLKVDAGEIFSTFAPHGANISANNFSLGFGQLSSNDQINWFSGRIDDFCFANKRLDDFEARALYSEGSGISYPFDKPVLFPSAMAEAILTSDDLENGDTTLADSTNGGGTTSEGIIGAARKFSASLEQSDEFEVEGLCDARGDFTISFWSKLDSTAEGAHPILNKPGGGDRCQYAFYRTQNTIGVELGLSSGVTNMEASCDGNGEWVHTSLSVDPKTDSAILYVNGKEAARATIAGTFVEQRGALQLGMADLATPTSDRRFFDGSLDELTFHRRILSLDEVHNMYLLGKGIACWGDSFTLGPGAVRYSEMLEAERGSKVSNHGIFGANATQLSEQMQKNSIQSSWVTVIWAGWTTHTSPYSLQLTEGGLASMVQQLHARRKNPRFVILNVANHHHPDWESGGENHPDFHRALIAPINEMIATTYPDNYIDVDHHFIHDYVTTDPLDQMDQALGIIPRSLRINLKDGDQNFNDDTHLTSAGYAEVAMLIDAFLKERGW